MDLVTLDPVSKQPAKLIENYDSLIWTERFNTIGDFQIQTGYVDQFMTMLPEGTLLSLRETNHVMIVETHQIDRKKNSAQNLIISGRSFESILDRRLSVKDISSATADWQVVAKIPSDVAHFIINQVCVVGSADPADIFPSSVVQFVTPPDYLNTTGPNRQYAVPRGLLLSAVLQFLQTESKADPTTTPPTPKVEPHGIRAVRPLASGSSIAVEIYTGVDRGETIRFDATRDLLDDGAYLFSKVGSANVAYILGTANSAKLNKTATTPTGLDRRVILVDATQSGVNDPDSLRSHGETSLTDARETAIFDGSINQQLVPYVYGEDYYLGDIVKLVGDYDLDEKARVTEYIRSEDASGNKAYPTLVTVTE